MSFRAPLDLADLVADAAASEGMSWSDYLVRVVAAVHGYPESRLAAPGRGTYTDTAGVRWPERSDPDAADAVAGLVRSIKATKMAPAEFSAALGLRPGMVTAYCTGLVAVPAGVERRARRVGAGLRAARGWDWMTTAQAGEFLRTAVRDRHQGGAFRVCVRCRDDLRQAFDHEPRAVAAWETVPAGSGDARWDVLLAALVTHEFETHGLRPPDWATPDRHGLLEPWSLLPRFAVDLEVEAPTPHWLTVRNIHVRPHAPARTSARGARRAVSPSTSPTPGGAAS